MKPKPVYSHNFTNYKGDNYNDVRVFGLPICRGKGYPRFRTCIFKLHLLPTMCQV